MRYQVCVDASLAILWLLPTQKTPQADDLLEYWLQEGVNLITPPLFNGEVTSTIRLHVYLKKLLPEEGEGVFASYSALAVKTVNPSGLYRRAWELAKKYDRPRTYDMQYLALAEIEDCQLWTADKRLLNGLQGKSERVRWVEEKADS
jgi:predicted nucleic acid-binding protein